MGQDRARHDVPLPAPVELIFEAAIQYRGGLGVRLIDAQRRLRHEPLDRMLQLAIEPGKDPDAVGRAPVRVVSEAEAVVKLAARKPDAHQCRDEENRSERNALGIDGHRPIRHELVTRRPDAKRGMLDDEKAGLAVKRALDIDDPAVPQPRAALAVELPPELRAHLRDHRSLAGPQRLRSVLASPFWRGFVECAVDAMVEVAEPLEPGRHLVLARAGIAGARGVPEPRVVSGV